VSTIRSGDVKKRKLGREEPLGAAVKLGAYVSRSLRDTPRLYRGGFAGKG